MVVAGQPTPLLPGLLNTPSATLDSPKYIDPVPLLLFYAHLGMTCRYYFYPMPPSCWIFVDIGKAGLNLAQLLITNSSITVKFQGQKKL